MQHAEKERKPLLPIADARANRASRRVRRVPAPPFIGTRIVEPALETLRDYIDWQFFFHAWELKGRYPAILDAAGRARGLRRRAAAARRDRRGRPAPGARRLRLLAGAPPTATTSCVEDDGETRFSLPPPAGRVRRLAAEPLARRLRRARRATTSARSRSPPGIGADVLAARFEAELDDYRSIMVKAIADRLAEAFAEYLHERRAARVVRDRRRSSRARSSRRSASAASAPRSGIRRARTTREKRKLFELLDAERAGIALTESFAMTPRRASAGSISRIPRRATSRSAASGSDQVADYAARKGIAARRGRALAAARTSATSRRSTRAGVGA